MSAGARRAARGGGEAGFTLLEIVVALVVLGILLATLSRGTEFGIAAFDRQDRMAQTGGRLDAVDRALRRLLSEADPGTGNDARTLTGTAHAMAFRAPLPAAAGADPGAPHPGGGAGTPAMANLRLSVENHALVLASVPYRHVIPLQAPPAPDRTVLLDGVDGLDLSFWGGGAWHTQWGGEALPDLVRIRILFPDGDPRHWPDIVVAPARHPPG